MKNFYLVFLLLFLLPSLSASDWQRKATGPDYVEYFGLAKKEMGIASLEMLRDYNLETVFDEVSVMSIQTLREFNCSSKTTKVIIYKGFLENMGVGDLVLEKRGETQWEYVDKNTFLEYAMKTACRP
jgi:hypothetical protein